jgi:hypothetical protein
MLRRLDDEPLAVPDRVTDHLASCHRCSTRRAEIAHDTERAVQLFTTPQLVPDTDRAWAQLERELRRPAPARTPQPVPLGWRRARFPRVSLRTGLAMAAVGVVVVGTAAAASLTTIFSPTHVAAVTVSQGDLRAIAAITGLGDGRPLGGFSAPTGSTSTRFGTVTWSSPSPQPASSLTQAAAKAGIPVSLPTHLPSGVGAVQRFMVQPRATATVTFNARASGLAGSKVTIDAGPAVFAQYGATGTSGVSALVVVTMRRPVAQSTGASISQIETFLLSQRGLSPQLAAEIRLLRDPSTTLPVPVPSGAAVRSVRVRGKPGVLLADPSNAAAGVIWEDGQGMLHLVAGIVDSQDVLNVAGQLG